LAVRGVFSGLSRRLAEVLFSTNRLCLLSHSFSTRRLAQEEVKKARIPMANRDYCVDSLIPLNECRRENYYLPWKCEHERHAYELCQYKLYKLRTQK
jgi:NADH dehydrogenase (ubiquinone) 1 beta subcomplex subunit 7